MNYNRIFRVLNVIFLSCGYQVHWFNVKTRKFKISLIGLGYFISLAIWYAICFEQHFSESSIFVFLNELASVLHKCIRIHLLMGIKVMAFALFEMRQVTRALNSLMKVLPTNPSTLWSWNEIIAYVWIFSGLMINFGFALYMMIELEFLKPTLQQVMHGTAMFLPHYVLASSYKLMNVTSWILRVELQKVRSEVNEIFNKEVDENNTSLCQSSTTNCVELSVIPKPARNESHLDRALLLSNHLEAIVTASQEVNAVLQKQMMLLLSMSSVCLLGATYSIINYQTSWHLILEGPLGKTLMAFNIGVFVFICWDYICLCVANYFLEITKSILIGDINQIIKRRSAIEKELRYILKDMLYLMERKLKMRIYFNSSVTWETFVLINTLTGMAIAIYMMYLYLEDQIESLQSRLDDD